MADVVKEEETKPEALVRRLDPQALIEKAMESNQGIEVLERLFQLAKDVRAEQAREGWNQAMAEFQKSAPRILKTETADMGGKFSYKYAPLEAIMNAILPVMGPLGLSVSWRNRIEPGKVISNCRISHDLGHFEESGEVPMPVMEDKMGANGAQRVGIALTYSKRYSLLSIVGIAPEDDPDAVETRPPTPMPRRASESQQEGSGGELGNAWTGTIQGVTSRSGKNDKGPWNLYIIKGVDGSEFTTFDDKHAEFARAAGKQPVSILWKTSPKGGKNLLSIEPGPEPGAQE